VCNFQQELAHNLPDLCSKEGCFVKLTGVIRLASKSILLAARNSRSNQKKNNSLRCNQQNMPQSIPIIAGKETAITTGPSEKDALPIVVAIQRIHR
jgi:hypothetical protein